MLIFPTKYADVFLIRRYTLVINYLQEAVYRRKEKYKLEILQSSIRVLESSYRANLRKHLPVCQVHFQILEPAIIRIRNVVDYLHPTIVGHPAYFPFRFHIRSFLLQGINIAVIHTKKSNRTHKNHQYGQDVNGE